MINNVVLVGRTTKHLELKQNSNGTSYVQFTLAVNRNFKDESGKQQADFISCVVWSKQAENAAKFVGKGVLIGVEGRIQARTYDDDNGNRHYVTEVVANKITFLESKRNADPGPQEPVYYQNNQEAGKNTVDPFAPGYTNPINPDFNNPNFNPDLNYNNPFATATTRAGQMRNEPLINMNDADLPY